MNHYDTIDVVYQTMDALFRRGHFHLADQIIAVVDMRAPPVVLLAYVSISACARQHLPSRAPFLARVYTRLVREFGEGKAVNLLRGFRS